MAHSTSTGGIFGLATETAETSRDGAAHGNAKNGPKISRSSILFFEDNRLNVYAGQLEVRPPGAPTTGAGHRPGPIASPTCLQPLDSRPWRLLRLFFSTLSTA